MIQPRVLVAGIGNIFLGDDAFGVEVVRRLVGRDLPEDVRVVDFGIRGFDLAYALMDGYETAILVDALAHGGEPGTLYVLEPDFESVGQSGEQAIETHAMHPLKVLQLVRALGGHPGRLLVVGCEPATLGPVEDEDWQMGLSAPLEAVVDEAAQLVESLVVEALQVAPSAAAP